MQTIDLRSDTVTQPPAAMRAAMAAAEVGDDVYGEDPTVNRLEAVGAELLGQEAALFVASGTQGNLLALLSHCRRGDEYIAGQSAHCYRSEGGGAAALGGIQPQPLAFEADGTLTLDKVQQLLKPIDDHYARTRLLCLENTQAGKVLSPDYLAQAREFTRQHGLGLHLDGARLGNAAAALGVDLVSFGRQVDSVSFCLSKGLGAPAGTLLCGAREFIREARHWRKMVGGGMRQAGILAAAGLYALEHHLPALGEDHRLAEQLADGLGRLPGLRLLDGGAQTNMVFVGVANGQDEELRHYLKAHGILVGGYGQLRFVTHRDLTSADIDRVLAVCREYCAA